mmetsp:Transcript_32325/g.55924  ORF Transcript_32325/g.55924 Transcript_32325/m.55924 type:complete len:407 (+) Transcript_32325:2348-3568(+)
MCKSHTAKEPNLLSVSDPATLIGDIHGQFYDMMRVLDIAGHPTKVKLIFMGDYVDRGMYSCEVILLLYALKICYPERVILLRGNHECRQLTLFFNFRQECLTKYDDQVYDAIMDSFDCMPLACILNGRYLIVHGGLSPDLRTLDDISRIKRFKETPRSGSMCDILWSDPAEHNGVATDAEFLANPNRGCSYIYNSYGCQRFLTRNNLLTVIRAHEAQLEGYKFYNWGGTFPAVITLFSAPNYCNVYKNLGAIAKFRAGKLEIVQFAFSEPPYTLPDNLDAISWSLPFVIQKVLEMFLHIANPVVQDSSPKSPDIVRKKSLSSQSPERARADSLRRKVQSFSKMVILFRHICDNREAIMELKGLCPDNRLPRGLLMNGKLAIKSAIEAFTTAKSWDQVNERMPASMD